jgi:hypothetical protein
MATRRRRRSAALGVGAGVAAIAAVSPSWAWEPGGYLNPGGLAATSWGRDNRGAYGFEASYSYYPGEGQDDWFNFGPLAQWLWYTDGSKRFMAGGQVAWGGLGVELGWADRFGGDYAAQHSIHFAPYLSAGMLTMALRFSLGLHEGSDAAPTHGNEVALVFGLKLPIPVNGDPPPRFSSVSGHRGRPLRVAGEPRVAEARAGPGWRSRRVVVQPDVSSLSAAARSRLARAWERDALLEHASVGAFAALALRLLALGAPADLVERAQRASLQEVEHARMCFDLASAYAGEPRRPSALDGGDLGTLADVDDLAVETLVDGCLGEGVAAAEARASLRLCTDGAVRRVLARIARDEASHARLAWDVLAFALDRGAGAAVRRALAQLPGAGRGGAAGPEERALAAHGRLPAGVLARVEQRVRAAVVRQATRLISREGSERRGEAEGRAKT